MKKLPAIDALASQLTAAASASLVPSPAPAAILESTDRSSRPKSQKRGSVPVFLRIPVDLHAKLEAEAVNRTKATGKGVTVQQVIVDKLAEGA